ncbi:hypothetical protein NIES4072_59770 [Nostoc commune NIES-4072]|uniref:Uncharacterized protein n=1 Tax=Nostoc commune NIES-4072 TaxID=2005467 RepID=A0A2R5FW39_NOSCO|nr:hypothetical protein [Nostoc commune]BBD66748.1 hypothetical protein NIES4070_31170 [Nostoc commune HK-02]GBG22269.1 hypothetical protein NIES4072_59770 [Nostoc commune NIES-4072]
MKNHGFGKLVTFLNQLEQERISYTLAHHRDETIMVNVAVAGERWEVEFFEDGSVEVERFVSNGEINGEEVFSELFAMYSEPENHSAKHTQNAKFTTTT